MHMMLKLSISFFSLELLLLLYSIMVCSAGMNITTDEFSLLALKSTIKTHNSHHIIITNWSNNSSSSACDWVGVTCGSRHRRVIALDISQMGLSGTIPPHFGNLSFLVSLNASGNNFIGNFPHELTHLRRLRVFDFSNNNLSQEIPSWFGFLSNLRILNLKHNHFTGSIPLSFSNLSKLETLTLVDNQVNGSIPSPIFNISTLQSLELSYNQMTGTLPLDLGHYVTNLLSLHVTNNFLSGEIPKGLSRCSKLISLALNYNHFEGTIPAQLGNITTLEFFFLGGNNLRGRIPKEIGYLHDLKELYIENNHLTGLLPPHMFNMSSLLSLNLNTNNISGTIPREMSNLQKLKILYLQFNSLSGSIPWGIFNISSLLDLCFGFNHLSGSLPPKMGYNLPNIIGITLNINNLQGAIPSYISNCSELLLLNLLDNSFGGPIPTSLGELRFLKILHLSNNALKSESSSMGINPFTTFSNCGDLRELWVSDNPLNTILPSSFGNLSISLESFSAHHCDIKGKLSNGLGNLSSIVTLNLGGNELSGAIHRDAIRGLKSVQRLYFAENRLSGLLPKSICSLQNLGSLYLGENQIRGSIPVCIGNTTSLREIYLDSNRLRFSIPSSLWDLKDLLNLDLSSNLLNGSLQPEINGLKAAIYINLSSNRFSGHIPSTIGGIQQLINLSLANNLLHGFIPESFANMISLEYLDLSNNNLTGRIPKSLEKLRYLRFLNVSCNRLSGEIPSKGPFVNLSYQSFLCNEHLCGSPRLKVSPCNNVDSDYHRSIWKAPWIAFITVATLIVGITMTLLLLRKCNNTKKSTTTEVELCQEIMHPRITYHELLLATQGFDNTNLLGVGSFGSVYKGTFTNGLLLAIKVFNLQVEGVFKSFDKECQVLCNLRHRNLTKVITACSNVDFKALILQYMPNGSLDNWLYSDNQSFGIIQRLNIMIDVACALEYLHHEYSIPIVHCDLKPSNVLIDEDMVGHVSDFGIAKMLEDKESVVYTITMATIGYIAPEYGLRGMVSTRCDIYSYGIMLMEVFTKKRPNDEMFTGDLSLKIWVSNSLSNNNLEEIVDQALWRPDEGLEFKQKYECILSSILELALKCTSESPDERIDIRDVLAQLNKTKRQFNLNSQNFLGN